LAEEMETRKRINAKDKIDNKQLMVVSQSNGAIKNVKE